MAKPIPLKPGTRVGDYETVKAIGSGTQGITYFARHCETGDEVILQEFLPMDLAGRQRSDAHVQARRGKTKAFEAAITLFLQEARVLAQIHDPYIGRLREYTEARGTVFLLLDVESGRTLEKHLEEKKKLSDTELRQLFVPLLKGLRVAHSAGLLHRDINPGNIFLRDVGPPLLFGFGNAHRAIHDEPTGLESRVTPGYSPIEQYHEHAQVGPGSDLYALGAVLYRCVSGAIPVDATQRVASIADGAADPLTPAADIGRGEYSEDMLAGIDSMLRPMVDHRPASAGEVLSELTRPARPANPRLHTDIHAVDGMQRGNGPAVAPPGITPPRLTIPIEDRSQRHHEQRSPLSLKPMLGWIGAISAALIILVAWPSLKSLLDEPSAVPPEPAWKSDVEVPRDADPSKEITQLPVLTPDPTETVQFARERDDQRAAQFRELDVFDRKIRELITSGNEHIAAGNLITPPGRNALSDFQAILSMDQGHVEARLGIDKIVSLLIEDAETAISSARIKKAEEIIVHIKSIDAEEPAIEGLREEIAAYQTRQLEIAEAQRQEQEQQRLAESERRREQEQAEQERQQAEERDRQVADLLARGDAAMQSGQLTEPAAENALQFYRAILELDPKNDVARARISDIAGRYIERANKTLAADEFEQTESLLLVAAAIDPHNPTIGLFREQLKIRKDAWERAAERRAAEQKLAAERLEATALVEQPAVSQSNGETRTTVRTLNGGLNAYYGGDYIEAYRLLKPLADAGNTRAQFRIGVMYQRGRGVEQDPALGLRWMRRAFPGIQEAANSGEAWAQSDLAFLYESGLIVTKSDTDAFRWYKKAAEQGYAGAQTNLGTMYADGKGVDRDWSQAVKWLKRAAAQGDTIAQANLVSLGGVSSNPNVPLSPKKIQ